MLSDSEASNEGSHSKSRKKILNERAKPKKKKESSKKIFDFTQKAKYRFIENYNILTSSDDTDNESAPVNLVKINPVLQTDLQIKLGSLFLNIYERHFVQL